MPTEQPLGSADEEDAGSAARPSGVKLGKSPRKEDTEVESNAIDGSDGEANGTRRVSLSEGRSKHGETDESDDDESAKGRQTSKGKRGWRSPSLPSTQMEEHQRM